MNSLQRSLDILEHLGIAGPQSARDIATAVGVPPSTTYRILSMLRASGYVAANDNHFDLGIRMLGLVRKIDVGAALARVASPGLWSLVERFGETVVLSVAEGRDAVCVEAVEPRRAVRLSFLPGYRSPLHIGASAKPLLAFSSAETIDAYLADFDRDRTTVLRTHLQQIRHEEICVSTGELDEGAVGVGAAIFWNRDVVACVSVVGPIDRMNSRKIATVITETRNVAMELSLKLAQHANQSLHNQPVETRFPRRSRPVA